MWNMVLITLAVGAVLLACNRTPAPTATTEPTPTKLAADYSMAQLVRWKDAHAGLAFQLPGVNRVGLDERAGRIRIRMAPRRGAREELEALLSTLDVPRDAFAVDMGVRPLPGAGHLTRSWTKPPVNP